MEIMWLSSKRIKLVAVLTLSLLLIAGSAFITPIVGATQTPDQCDNLGISGSAKYWCTHINYDPGVVYDRDWQGGDGYGGAERWHLLYAIDWNLDGGCNCYVESQRLGPTAWLSNELPGSQWWCYCDDNYMNEPVVSMVLEYYSPSPGYPDYTWTSSVMYHP